MQLEPMPAEAVLAEAYGKAASEDYLAEEPGQRATARAILARIEEHTAPGRLADLGCWVGFFPDEARRRGWQAVGVEPSEWAAAYARERLGLEIENAPLLDADLPAGGFQAIFMGDVIEHLPDPGAALGRVRDLLAPDGVLALTLPDAGSRMARLLGRRWWSVIPTHVHYFTRASLRTLLGRCGFRVLAVTTAPKRFTVRYYLSRLGGYSPALGRLAVAAAERAGLADRLWAPDLRDRMLVLASPAAVRLAAPTNEIEEDGTSD